jgi:antitoxin VapB
MTNTAEKEVRAKLFVNGRSQAVRLPKEFRFEGKEVRVRRVLGGVLLEPVETKMRTAEDIERWFAELDALRGDDLFPEREPQNPAPIREYFD